MCWFCVGTWIARVTGGRNETIPVVRSSHDDCQSDGFDNRHVEGKGRPFGIRGGHRACSGRGGLSPRGSDRSMGSSLPNESLTVLEPPVPHFSDRSQSDPSSKVTVSGAILIDNSVLQVLEEPKRLASISSQGALKRDKNGKGIVIEASGSVTGQMLATVPM